jgi:hypothetical protein
MVSGKFIAKQFIRRRQFDHYSIYSDEIIANQFIKNVYNRFIIINILFENGDGVKFIKPIVKKSF